MYLADARGCQRLIGIAITHSFLEELKRRNVVRETLDW